MPGERRVQLEQIGMFVKGDIVFATDGSMQRRTAVQSGPAGGLAAIQANAAQLAAGQLGSSGAA